MVQNIYGLTPLQEGMLFHTLYKEEGATPYFEQMVFNMRGEIHIEIFKESWQRIVKRYEIFRTIFVHKNTPTPKQVVLKKWNIDFVYENICENKHREKYLSDFISQDRERYFELSKKPPLRVSVLKCEENLYQVVFSFHHILMDGWSGAIVFGELFTIYNALIKKEEPHLPSVKPYSYYIKWLKKQDMKQTKDFWNSYLENYNQIAKIPQKENVSEYQLQKFFFHISEEKSQQLNSFVERNSLTLNVVIQSLWGVVIANLNTTNDVVFGATVSGRVDKIEGIEKMVGLFINAIPIRVQFQKSTTLLELFKTVMKSSLEAQNHHYYSLAEIQNLTPLKENLIQQLMVFENYPSVEEKENASAYQLEMVEVFNQTNYDFDITVAPAKSIEVMFKYNKFAYEENLIASLENAFEKMVDLVVSESNQALSTLRFEGFKSQNKNSKELFISSTFTSEPIEEGLTAWCETFDTPLSVEFGGYSQVIQNLIDSNSPLYRTDGLNALLIRFEDVLRFMQLDTLEAKQEAILKRYKQIETLLEENNFTIPTFIPIFKPQEGELFSFLTKLYTDFEKKFKEIKNIYTLDFRTLDRLYQVETVFDEKANEVGHIPFSDGFFFAMGSFLFRKIYAYYNPHFKVIALDCDNTIWGGVVGEDGVLGVDISGGYLALQRFVLERKEEGFLIVLSSKNNEADVWELFEKNEKMLLKREDIVHAKINWQPKSQNLREMAKELNLGLNSFIFLDDNPLECSEVIQNAPEVLALPLPKESNFFESFLAHTWAMDKLQVTKEDKNRTQMYKAETQRNQSSEKLSMDDFLASLGLTIYMNKMLDSQLERVAQLTQRTNQFNVSTIRRSESDIQTLLEDENSICWTVNVADKFGDYGLVGVVISKKQENRLFIDTFLMSCRVLGRGVERSILAGLKHYALSNNLDRVEIDFYPTNKNRPALEFIENHHFILESESEEKRSYGISLEGIADTPEFVLFHFDTGEVMEKRERSTTLNQNSKRVNVISSKTEATSLSTLDFDFTFLEQLDVDEVENLPHKKFYKSLKFHKSSDVEYLIEKSDKRESIVEFIAPSSEDEIKLATIYKELLTVVQVGIRDSFFELGGHSLTATRLLSRIEQQFNVELGLKDIFSNPTIEKLLHCIDINDKNSGQQFPLASKQEHYPLSNAQNRVWLIEQMGGSVAYNMPIALSLKGQLNIERLNRALNETISQHESLRTRFILVDDEPKQQIVEEVSITIQKISKNMAWVEEYIKEDAHQPFELQKAPLLIVNLFEVQKNEYVLYLKMHHIVSDGWSLGVLTQELSQRYNGVLVEPLRLHYKDYTLWQQSLLKQEEMNKSETYWLEKFKGEISTLNFPTDLPRPQKQTFDGTHVTLDFSHFLEPIHAFTQQNNTTLFMFLTAITKVVLSRYTMQSDIVLGCPISGRDNIELENQIGFYAKTLALRDLVDFDGSFEQLLFQVKQTVLNGYEHQGYPFEKLIDKLSIPRDLSRSSLFDFAISLNQNYNQLKLDYIELNSIPIAFEVAQFDITFNFFMDSERLGLNLNYNTNLFYQESMNRLLQHVQNTIQTVLSEPKQSIKSIDFLTPLEREEQFTTKTLFQNSIVEHFVQQVKKRPMERAVSFNNKSLSYQLLDKLSNRVANYLIEKQGVVENEHVAFWFPRSELTVVALLGILKARATFLPLHGTLPKERVEYIVDDAQAKLLTLEEMTTAIRYKNEQQPISSSQLQESAYIIYTSGTTGNPKGVDVSEKSLLNLCDWYIKDFDITKDSKSLLMIPISFDASIKNILAPLCVGGEIIVAEDRFDPHALLETIEEKKITLINCVPSAFRSVLDISDNLNAFASLRYLAFGGERLDLALFRDFYKKSGVKLFNIYGPTEACDITTCYEITSKDINKKVIPIGKPISNAKVFILDKFRNIAPTNVVGELMIGGIGLANGYLNDRVMSQKNFVTDPIFGRLYRSGDLAYKNSDGDILFVGREDEQVKVNGNRVELSEIEQNFLELKEINWAMVLFHENRLVAYFRSSIQVDTLLLKRALQSKLPSYMTPHFFVQIKNTPLTQNGKVDKKVLLKIPYFNKESIHKEKILTTFEKEILTVFKEVLNREVSLLDNFFEVGGDSLGAVKVISKINRLHKKELRLSSLFEHQKLEDFIAFLSSQEAKKKPKRYEIFNPNAHGTIFLFPALMDLMDATLTASKLAKLLPEYKIYSFEFFVTEDYIIQLAKLINQLEKEEEFLFLGYSSGGNIAFEVLQKLHRKPNKLILLDSWRVLEKKSLDYQEVQLFMDRSVIDAKSETLDSYMSIINGMINEHPIDVDIVLIKSEKEYKNKDEQTEMGKINQFWHLLTTKTFKIYQGFGAHQDMLNDDALMNNGGVIHQILSKERSIR